MNGDVSLAASGLVGPPFDGAEARVAEEVVGERHRLHRLVPVAPAGHAPLAGRGHVMQAEGVRTVHAHGEPHGGAVDHLVSKLLRIGRRSGAQADDPVLAALRLEHRPLAEDEAEAEERLRNHPVSVVTFRAVTDGAGGAEANAEEGRALEGDRGRQPPLADGAERDIRGRDAEDPRRQVLVAAEEPPHPPEIVAQLVFRTGEETANREVLDGVDRAACVGHRRELEEEEVERALVLIPGLPGKPIDHVVVEASLLLVNSGREARGGRFRGEGEAEPQANEDFRIAARENGLEPVAEDETVEGGGRREQGGAQLPPEPRRLTAALEEQAGHPEQGLAHEAAADGRGDVVVDGGFRRLAGRLPQKAPQEGIPQRLPVAETRRARESGVEASLIRVPDLVDAEGVGVEYGRRLQVPPDRAPAGAVRVRVDEGPVERIEAYEESADLESRNEIALALSRLPVQPRVLGPLLRVPRPRHQEGKGKSTGAEGRLHAAGTGAHAARWH